MIFPFAVVKFNTGWFIVTLLPNANDCFNRKNTCGPEMALVTTYCPFNEAGVAETGAHTTGGIKFVV